MVSGSLLAESSLMALVDWIGTVLFKMAFSVSAVILIESRLFPLSLLPNDVLFPYSLFGITGALPAMH